MPGYGGHNQTLLPVREIGLKVCTLIINRDRNFWPDFGFEPRPLTVTIQAHTMGVTSVSSVIRVGLLIATISACLQKIEFVNYKLNNKDVTKLKIKVKKQYSYTYDNEKNQL